MIVMKAFEPARIKALFLPAALLILTLWLTSLLDAGSFLSPYLFCAIAGAMAITANRGRMGSFSGRESVCPLIFAALFALSVLLANYELTWFANLPKICVLLLGGWMIARHVLLAALRLEISPAAGPLPAGKKSGRIFCAVFFSVSLVYLLALFLCYRPGILSPDSIEQVSQIRTGIYTNHHPFWHTMIIRACLALGMRLFHNINDAVTVYSVFQLLCMAAVFSYACMTLAQGGTPLPWIAAAAAAFALLPYHILYSVTMWKDVLFGGAVLLFVCAAHRVYRDIGRKGLNFFLLALGALGSCLLRSNGFAAFVLAFCVFFFKSGKSRKKMLGILLSLILAAFILIYPLLGLLGIQQPDPAEFLSIPEQQIGRLIVDQAALSGEETALLQKILDFDAVRKNYIPTISDPIKIIIRDTNPAYLREHLTDYLKLWLKLGLRYPAAYLKAWIDQTKGYWNAGYEHRVVSTGVWPNAFGIEALPRDHPFSAAITRWVSVFLHNPMFELFRSIGLHVWILLLCFFIQIAKGKEGWLTCVLPITVVLSLLVSTPVSNEFRYAYAVFTTVPFLVLTTFTGGVSDER